MHRRNDNEISRLLRLKRYEQPPGGLTEYTKNFRREFWRRQRERDELFRQPRWRICLERGRDFVWSHNRHLLAYSFAGIVAVALGTAVIPITIQQRPKPVQVVAESSPVPKRSMYAEAHWDVARPGFIQPFDRQPAVLSNGRAIRMVPLRLLPRANPLRVEEFIPFNLEGESLEDQSMLQK